MMSMKWTWSGDTKMAKRWADRAKGKGVERYVLPSYKRWLLQRIIDMFRGSGYVRGEQKRWKPLSEWTVEQKGHEAPNLSDKLYAYGTMVRSYVVKFTRRGLKTWVVELTNKARSKSPWSRGFDYPSVIHTGKRGQHITPRPDGPGFLAWRIKGGGWQGPFSETFPGPTPARPHMDLFDSDAGELAERIVDYVLKD